MSKTKRVNADLIRLVVAQIEDTPQHWSQKSWVQHNCNTKFCFAGWATFLSGHCDGWGAPTAKGRRAALKINARRNGWARLEEDQLFRAEPDYDNPDPDNLYYPAFPYEEIAYEQLGFDRDKHWSIFVTWSAQPPNASWEAPEDIEILKDRITELTGVTFA